MKCNRTNACVFNPNKVKMDNPSRNYSRQPIRDHEHGECPHRSNGLCNCNDMHILRIGFLRNEVLKYRTYLEKKSKGVYFAMPYERDVARKVEKYAKVELLTDPKNHKDNGYYVFGLAGYKGGDMDEFLKGLIDYWLNKITKELIYYNWLSEKFDLIKIVSWKDGIKIELFGDIESFNDESIYNWSDTDQDTDFNKWYSKEFQVDGVEVNINIREKAQLKEDGELNNER